MTERKALLQLRQGKNSEVKESVEVSFDESQTYLMLWCDKWSHTFDGNGRLIYSTDLENAVCGES